jgi:hypothetical protein
MGNRRLYKIECLHTLGTPESERLKVAAPDLFHPTASPPFQKVGFSILRHSLLPGEGKVLCLHSAERKRKDYFKSHTIYFL